MYMYIYTYIVWAQRFRAGSCTPVVQTEADRASGGQVMDVVRLARGTSSSLRPHTLVVA